MYLCHWQPNRVCFHQLKMKEKSNFSTSVTATAPAAAAAAAVATIGITKWILWFALLKIANYVCRYRHFTKCIIAIRTKVTKSNLLFLSIVRKYLAYVCLSLVVI